MFPCRSTKYTENSQHRTEGTGKADDVRDKYKASNKNNG